MTSRSFSTLVGLFPDLGVHGAWHEGKDREVDPSLRPMLDRAEAGYDDRLRLAIAFWVTNNEKILPYMLERNNLGGAAAMAACVERHAAKLICAGIEHKEADAFAVAYGRTVEGHADRLMADVGAPLFPNQEVFLYRGTAVRLSEFEALWAPGRTITFPVPLACTLNPDFAPLHFAWKRQKLVRAEFPNEPVVSIVLRIKIGAAPANPLIWAGFVHHQQPEQDYRWQQEILTPPGFRFTVTSHRLMPAASANLYCVEASGSFATP